MQTPPDSRSLLPEEDDLLTLEVLKAELTQHILDAQKKEQELLAAIETLQKKFETHEAVEESQLESILRKLEEMRIAARDSNDNVQVFFAQMEKRLLAKMGKK